MNKGTTYRPIYLAKAPSTLTTYNLVLTDELDQKNILYDFQDMSKALKAMTKLEAISNCSLKNEVKENIQSKSQNRRRRGR